MDFNHFSNELAVLEIVRSSNFIRPRKLTSGQLYMALIRLQSDVPAIERFMAMIDELVKEGLLISAMVLDHDPSFPYTQHIILGLTEPGEAALEERSAQADHFLPMISEPAFNQDSSKLDAILAYEKHHFPCTLCRAYSTAVPPEPGRACNSNACG